MTNFEEQYLAMIIQTYEKAVMKKQTSQGYKMMLVKSLDDLKSVTSVSKKSISSFPGAKFDFEKNPSSINDRSKKKVDKKALGSIGIDLAPEIVEDYLEKCFGCDLRLQFDFQMMPPDFLLNAINDLLDEMKALLAQVEKLFSNDKKKLEQLCAIAKLFDPLPCPQDIMAIIMALKILLGKYSDIGLSLKINWLSLLGPIIQLLVQLLTMIINVIFSGIMGPIDCTLSQMTAGLDLLRVMDPSTYITKNEQSTFVEGKLDHSTIQDPNPIRNQDVIWPSGAEFNSNFNISHLLEAKPGHKNFFDMSGPEQIVIAVNEGKAFLSNFQSKMLKTVEALNGLTKGGKFLEIRSLTICIFIADLIKLLVNFMTTDFNHLCTDITKRHILENYIRDLTGSNEVNILTDIETGKTVARLVKTDNIVEEVELNTCSLAKNSVDLTEIKNILSEIEKITNGN